MAGNRSPARSDDRNSSGSRAEKVAESSVEPRDFSDQNSVSCEVCEREVPADEAQSVEGRDSVWYFCGMDCYEEWRRLAERR